LGLGAVAKKFGFEVRSYCKVAMAKRWRNGVDFAQAAPLFCCNRGAYSAATERYKGGSPRLIATSIQVFPHWVFPVLRACWCDFLIEA